jgi:hypothetical protein
MSGFALPQWLRKNEPANHQIQSAPDAEAVMPMTHTEPIMPPPLRDNVTPFVAPAPKPSKPRRRKPLSQQRRDNCRKQLVYQQRHKDQIRRGKKLMSIYIRQSVRPDDAQRIAELFNHILDRDLMLELANAIIERAERPDSEEDAAA